MRGIGLFGGTFNPIHTGHLRVAEEVFEGFGLERIYFIPSAIPPHKTQTGLASAKDRYQMLAEAIYANPHFIASDAEIQREGRSFTIDTVLHFTSAHTKDTPCYLIVGSDAFFEIDTWKSYQELFDRVPFIVMKRPAADAHARPFQEIFAEYIKSNITDGYEFSEDGSSFHHHKKQAIYLFDVTPLDISSTRIRELVRKGRSVKYLVPDSVCTYIQHKGLYK